MATFPVKWLHSGMRGAPVKSGSGAGSIIALLDACLNTGFGSVTLTSLTVAGGVATAVVSSGDSFDAFSVITVAGATPAALNGEQRVLTASSTGFTFATTAPDGTATGTITAKYAPVGNWEKTYTGTNKAVFRSVHPEANGHYLRVDEAAEAQMARVVGYGGMTDVDTGSGPFPTSTQYSGGGRWFRSQSNNATATEWAVVADCRMFYFCNALYAGTLTTQGYGIWAFGDANALAASDGWATVLAISSGNPAYGNGSVAGSYVPVAAVNSGGMYVPRKLGGAGAAVSVGVRQYMRGEIASSVDSGDAPTNAGGFGNATATSDGKLVFSPVHIYQNVDASWYSPRADLPGLFHLPYNNARGAVHNLEQISGAGALAGRTLLCVAAGSGNITSSVNGITVFDITGPWR